MKITHLSSQIRDPHRVNVSIDGKYRFSLDVAQVIDLGVKEGQEIDEARLGQLEQEGEFGKLYARTLEYCLIRPRSRREVNDYLYKKARPRQVVSKKTGKKHTVEGVASGVVERVSARLAERGYVNDEKFARYWVENRNIRKGSSFKKLEYELVQKGVAHSTIEAVLSETDRDEHSELYKIAEKKISRYTSKDKFIQYLQRQGFRYSDIMDMISECRYFDR